MIISYRSENNFINSSDWLSMNEIAKRQIEYCTVKEKDIKNVRKIDIDKNSSNILITTFASGFGDHITAAIFCQILSKNGYNVSYAYNKKGKDRDFSVVLENIIDTFDITDIKKEYFYNIDFLKNNGFNFSYSYSYSRACPYNMIFQNLLRFGIYDLKTPIDGFVINKNKLNNNCEYYDVIMMLESGRGQPIRGYALSRELEDIIKSNGLKVLNINAKLSSNLGLIEFLSLVSKSKIYIGIETGPTHAASWISKKSIILQSGLHSSCLWNIYNKSHIIESDWPCSIGVWKKRSLLHDCKKYEDCIYSNACINRYNPKDIFGIVAKEL